MNSQPLSFDDIRRVGMDALSERLGAVGMIRFMQQTETGWGNYTVERERWLGNPELSDLFNTIKNSESPNNLGAKEYL